MTPRRSSIPDLRRDREIVRAVESWFAANARDLPWRKVVGHAAGVPLRDPYRSAVSEFMLQQTQVSRVVERFEAFVARFPTVESLAAADESEVLALWSGLGYYRRARMLHAAARVIVAEHGGRFPSDPEVLRGLPGVGRYTAGAVASMALGQRTPLVDGNVVRVLHRLEARRARTGDAAAELWAWERAAALVRHAEVPGRFNEGLMELGAVICTPSPAAPACGECPLARRCAARRDGSAASIPLPRAPAERRELFCSSVLIRDGQGRVGIVQRGTGGMWPGLWQAPTLERTDRPATSAEVRRWLAASARNRARLSRIESFVHQTTHRLVTFEVWALRGAGVPDRPEWRWIAPGDLGTIGLANPQRRILACGATATAAGRPSRKARQTEVGTGPTRK